MPLNWLWMLGGLLLLAAVLWFLVPGGKGDMTAQDEVTVTLHEEQLQVRKRRERLADVATHREVIREMRTVTVPVEREEFVVEKDGAEVARIPLSEQRVELSTRTVPLNEVSVYEREWEETERVQAAVKKEVARVETAGETEVREVPYDP